MCGRKKFHTKTVWQRWARMGWEQNSCTATEGDLVLPRSLFFGRRGQKNQYHLTPTILSLRKAHQGVEYFELNRIWPNLTPRYFLSLSILWNWPEISSTLIQLKMPRHPQQGNTDRVLVENNFHTSVTWRSKFSAAFLQLQCVSAKFSVYIELLFLMTQTWTLFKL